MAFLKTQREGLAVFKTPWEHFVFKNAMGMHTIFKNVTFLKTPCIPMAFAFKYGGHATTLLVYFIFRGARAEDWTRGCLTAARRATCGLRCHPHGVCLFKTQL